MKIIVAETSSKTSTLVLLQLPLKFSSNILHIKYQMLVLAHTDLRKYEATRVSVHILQTEDPANKSTICLQTSGVAIRRIVD